MKDFLGNEIRVGDEVVCIAKRYRYLVRGRITKITPEKVKIDLYGNNLPHVRLMNSYTIEPSCVVVVNSNAVPATESTA